VTVKVCAAIVAVPVRAAPVLAAMVSLTVPGPVPDAPEAIVIQLAFDAESTRTNHRSSPRSSTIRRRPQWLRSPG
jgi:hypothetical protein